MSPGQVARWPDGRPILQQPLFLTRGASLVVLDYRYEPGRRPTIDEGRWIIIAQLSMPAELSPTFAPCSMVLRLVYVCHSRMPSPDIDL